MSLPVKEFLKSVKIWGSYRQEFNVLFFWLTVCINIRLLIRISTLVLFTFHRSWNYDYSFCVLKRFSAFMSLVSHHTLKAVLESGCSTFLLCLRCPFYGLLEALCFWSIRPSVHAGRGIFGPACCQILVFFLGITVLQTLMAYHWTSGFTYTQSHNRTLIGGHNLSVKL